MKILMLSDAASSHTVKWVTSLANEGVEIHLFSLGYEPDHLRERYQNILTTYAEVAAGPIPMNLSIVGKFRMAVRQLKLVISEIQPDLIHAHYATSYGLLGSLADFQPFLLSVWGSDVFEFPKKSILHRLLIKYTLGKAHLILSTSQVMAKETTRYTSRPIEVTPFGIDVSHFKPGSGKEVFQDESVVVGTIKTLEKLYGIHILIDAFARVAEKHSELSVRLMIVGGGSQEAALKEQAKDLDIDSITHFVGRVPHEEVVHYCNSLDIYVAVSLQESFGVAVLEASACAKPVVVSSAGGLPEVVENGKTGWIVPVNDVEATAEAIEKLVIHPDMRREMGDHGRRRVENHFDWRQNVGHMIEIYRRMVNL